MPVIVVMNKGNIICDATLYVPDDTPMSLVHPLTQSYWAIVQGENPNLPSKASVVPNLHKNTRFLSSFCMTLYSKVFLWKI